MLDDSKEQEVSSVFSKGYARLSGKRLSGITEPLFEYFSEEWIPSMEVSFGPWTHLRRRWYRGNLHSHTTNSDGAYAPEDLVRLYAERGYDFLALSDHDHLTDPQEVLHRTPVILIPALEAGGGAHILCVGLSSPLEKTKDRQEVINQVQRQGGIAILNHPKWQTHFNHFPLPDMFSLEGYWGIEIFNGVIRRLEGTPYALDRWDQLLSEGRLVWGFATDDAHRWEDIGQGWIMVGLEPNFSGPPHPSQILLAIQQGSFYSSTGVYFTLLEYRDSTLRVVTSNGQRIRFIGRWGRELKVEEGNGAEYAVRGDEGYIRVEAEGSKGAFAWSQPLWLMEGEKTPVPLKP